MTHLEQLTRRRELAMTIKSNLKAFADLPQGVVRSDITAIVDEHIAEYVGDDARDVLDAGADEYAGAE